MRKQQTAAVGRACCRRTVSCPIASWCPIERCAAMGHHRCMCFHVFVHLIRKRSLECCRVGRPVQAKRSRSSARLGSSSSSLRHNSGLCRSQTQVRAAPFVFGLCTGRSKNGCYSHFHCLVFRRLKRCNVEQKQLQKTMNTQCLSHGSSMTPCISAPLRILRASGAISQKSTIGRSRYCPMVWPDFHFLLALIPCTSRLTTVF